MWYSKDMTKENKFHEVKVLEAFGQPTVFGSGETREEASENAWGPKPWSEETQEKRKGSFCLTNEALKSWGE